MFFVITLYLPPNGVVLNPQPITKLPNETTTAKDLANRAYLFFYKHGLQVN
jgi:hypothetical protein